MNKIIIANWKMNETFGESAEWLEKFNKSSKGKKLGKIKHIKRSGLCQ